MREEGFWVETLAMLNMSGMVDGAARTAAWSPLQ